MKKEKKKRRGIKGLGIVALLIILALFLGKGFGLGPGKGKGEGKGSGKDEQKVVTNVPEEEKEEEKDVADAVSVTIEVKQGQYFIDGAEKTLADIESMLTAEDAKNTSFSLEDNYASEKAWEEVKALFTKYSVDVKTP